MKGTPGSQLSFPQHACVFSISTDLDAIQPERARKDHYGFQTQSQNGFSSDLFTKPIIPAVSLGIVLNCIPMVLNPASHLHSEFPMSLVRCGIRNENL